MDERKKDLEDIEELEDEELEDENKLEKETEDIEDLEDEAQEEIEEEKKPKKKKKSNPKPVAVEEEPMEALEPIKPAGFLSLIKSPFGASVIICTLVAIFALIVILISGGGEEAQSHIHEFSEWQIVKNVTCFENGEESRACSCGELETRVIASIGHTEVIDGAVAATCTKGGLTEGKHCSECGAILLAQNSTPIVDHQFGDDNICDVCSYERCDHANLVDIDGKAPTCEEEGLSPGKRCSNCGVVVVEQEILATLPHNYGTDDFCDDCNHQKNTSCQHTNTEVVKGKDATCTTTGLTDGLKCKDCGEYIVNCESIAIKPHTEVIDEAKDATCEAEGLTQGMHCYECKQVLVEQMVVPKTAHTYTTDFTTCDVCGEKRERVCYHINTQTIEGKAATCTEFGLTDGEKCLDCGETLISQNPILLKNHTVVIDHAKDATCTVSGLTQGSHCSVCGTVIVAQQTVEKKPHSEVVIEAIKSTCTTSGLTEGKYCFECGNILVEPKFTEALGHEYATTTIDPNCTERGYTTYTCSRCEDTYRDDYVEKLEHSASEWIVDIEPTYTSTGKKHKECTECGMIFEAAVMPMLTHTYVSSVTAPTCTQIGYTTHTCTDCGHSYTDNYMQTLGHVYGEWIERTPATCVTDGISYRTCGRCANEESKVILAKGHELYTFNAQAPTCTQNGCDEFEICANCSYNSKVIIPAIGHKASDWIIDVEATDDTDGSKHKECTECGETVETSIIPALTHSYTSVVTEPTCTSKGYTTHTCSHCGNTYVDDYTDALGHHFGEWHEVKAPTCEEDGEKNRQCNICAHIETMKLDKLQHVLGEWTQYSAPTCEQNGENRKSCVNCDYYISETVASTKHSYTISVVEPSCTQQGYSEYLCSICQHTYKDNYTSLKGHSFGSWLEIASTCTTNGSFKRECTECGALEERIVVATGHTYSKQIIEPTCTERGYTKHTCHCGDTYNNEFKDAIGHNFGEWYVSKAPSCTEIGEQRRDCSRCSSYETNTLAKLDHDCDIVVVAPTCTLEGYTIYTCKGCGYTFSDDITESLGHNIVEYVFQEPTCTSMGLIDRKCDRCGEFVERVNSEKLGHRIITHPAQAPTCTEDGWKQYVTCTRCEYTTYRVDPATGHTLQNYGTLAPTCTEIGWNEYEVCTVCQYTTYEEIPALGHDIETFEGKAPTCTENGWKAYEECTKCTYSTYEMLDAIGHDYIEHEAKEPTCTEIGWYAYKECTICGQSNYNERKALGHRYTKTETVAPTCTEKGYTAKICQCGYSLVESYTEPTGHSFGEWVVIRESSCTEVGEMHKQCSNCEYFEAQIIEKCDHSYENGVCTVCGTITPTTDGEDEDDTLETQN